MEGELFPAELFHASRFEKRERALARPEEFFPGVEDGDLSECERKAMDWVHRKVAKDPEHMKQHLSELRESADVLHAECKLEPFVKYAKKVYKLASGGVKKVCPKKVRKVVQEHVLGRFKDSLLGDSRRSLPGEVVAEAFFQRETAATESLIRQCPEYRDLPSSQALLRARESKRVPSVDQAASPSSAPAAPPPPIPENAPLPCPSMFPPMQELDGLPHLSEELRQSHQDVRDLEDATLQEVLEGLRPDGSLRVRPSASRPPRIEEPSEEMELLSKLTPLEDIQRQVNASTRFAPGSFDPLGSHLRGAGSALEMGPAFVPTLTSFPDRVPTKYGLSPAANAHRRMDRGIEKAENDRSSGVGIALSVIGLAAGGVALKFSVAV